MIECLASIHLCRVRITRLDALGNPVAGPNNTYVTDNPMMLQVKPTIETGQDKTLIGGCDCISASYRGYDKLKRFEFELDLAKWEAGLIEMLTGASIINDNIGEAIGVSWANQLSCDDSVQPNVALEAWQDGWNDDHQDSEWPYIHWVWPATRWQVGDNTLQNDFNTPKMTGYSRSNPNWAAGIYKDYPAGLTMGNLGGWFYTSVAPPASRCGYITTSLT